MEENNIQESEESKEDFQIAYSKYCDEVRKILEMRDRIMEILPYIVK